MQTRIMAQFSTGQLAWLDQEATKRGKSRAWVLRELVTARMQGEAPRANIRLRELAARVNAEG